MSFCYLRGSYMTETEKRRIELLNQMKNIYSDKNIPPAIHPRYTGAYRSIYKNDGTVKKKRTAGKILFRLVVLVCLVGAFYVMKGKDIEEVRGVVGKIQEEVRGCWDTIDR